MRGPETPSRPPAAWLAGAVVLLGAASLLGCGGEATEARAYPAAKNLLVLAIDTLRADDLGTYGAGEGASPNIDALAAESVVFENCGSHASWTLPSFASTLTSLYTSTHGCWDFETRLDDAFVTLPELLQAAGFDTHGVASHIFFRERYGLTQGFDDFDASLAYKRKETGWMPLTSPEVSRRGVQWLDGRAGNDAPWLLWLHYFDPHYPYIDHALAAGGPRTPEERGRYRAEIAFTDAHVGTVLEALERNGFADETCVLLISDHGESFGEHAGVQRHARSLYRAEVRVPLVLHLPGAAARRVPDLVRTVDLLPTLLEVFGIEPPAGDGPPLEGTSFLPLLEGRPWEAGPLLAEIGLHADAHHVRALTGGRWKLIERREGGFLLFDVEADPAETRDLSAARPDVVERMRVEMEALRRRAEAHGGGLRSEERLEHSAEDLDHLRAMGYVGDEE